MFSDYCETKFKINMNKIPRKTLNIWQQMTHFQITDGSKSKSQ